MANRLTSPSLERPAGGFEFIGSWNAKNDSAFTLAVQASGAEHHTIPPGAHTFQADVETVHRLIEDEFYEVEAFCGLEDFLHKPYTYNLRFNFARTNSYKENHDGRSATRQWRGCPGRGRPCRPPSRETRVPRSQSRGRIRDQAHLPRLARTPTRTDAPLPLRASKISPIGCRGLLCR